jgi:hypothetical protein
MNSYLSFFLSPSIKICFRPQERKNTTKVEEM